MVGHTLGKGPDSSESPTILRHVVAEGAQELRFSNQVLGNFDFWGGTHVLSLQQAPFCLPAGRIAGTYCPLPTSVSSSSFGQAEALSEVLHLSDLGVRWRRQCWLGPVGN